ncbi:hypothetical protein EMMF5_003967 [Cystobasidiomycetes sp. EMM_F5]
MSTEKSRWPQMRVTIPDPSQSFSSPSQLLFSAVPARRSRKRFLYFVAGLAGLYCLNALFRWNDPLDPGWTTPRVAIPLPLTGSYTRAKAIIKPKLMLSTYLPSTNWPQSMNGLDLDRHPIPSLLAKARLDWRNKLIRQSQTLSEARINYVERYEQEPPHGFNDWHKAAVSAQHIMIDEYDQLMRRINLMSRFSPEQIQERTWAIGSQPTFALVHIEGGKVSVTCATLDAEIVLAVSELPDPRVFPSWEEVHGTSAMTSNITDIYPSSRLHGTETFWDTYRLTCPPRSAARLDQRDPWLPHPAPDNSILSTLAWWRSHYTSFKSKLVSTTAEDFCSDPSLHELHSQFYQDARAVSSLYPVFGSATMESAAGQQELYKFSDTPKPFQEKKSQIYWRGTVNPGYDRPPNRQADFPRRRFLEMSSTSPNASRSLLVAHPATEEHVMHIENLNSTAINSQIMDVAFSTLQVEQCGPAGSMACDTFYHSGIYSRLDGRFKLDSINDYKFLLDLDGLSYSARFQALLASAGVVLKATIYDEFYSDWIQPWMHFIPVSMTFDEVYDIFAYFIGLKPNEKKSVAAIKRQEQLATIGTEAAEWKRNVFRREDIDMYVYRMCLEYARLYRGANWVAKSPDPYYVKHIKALRTAAAVAL